MTLLSELHAAVVEGNAKKVAELCAQHREHSSTPPSAACWEALNETMTSQASDGTTPLIQAATAGNVAMVQTLLAAGARADVQAQDGYTAVMVAACGRLASANDCLAELLSASKALDVEDEDGFTALMHAVRKGNTRGVRLLLDAKADANAGSGGPPLALVEDATITHLLLQAGAAVDGRDEFQRTPLFWVAKRGAAEAALLAAAQGEAGAACSDSGSDTALTTLIDHGATVDALDEDGMTPLLAAARSGHTQNVRALASAGADLDATCKGKGALAMAESHPDTVEALVQLRASARGLPATHKAAVSAANWEQRKHLLLLRQLRWCVLGGGTTPGCRKATEAMAPCTPSAAVWPRATPYTSASTEATAWLTKEAGAAASK